MGVDGGGRTPDKVQPSKDGNGEELEQAKVALEDAHTEIAALARERDEALSEVSALKAMLAEERARREETTKAVRLRSEADAAAQASWDAERDIAEELTQLSMQELQVTAAELSEANAALLEREQRLRLIFDGATDYAIFVLDIQGRVTEWNPGAERLLGFTEAEILLRRPDAIWTAADRAARQPELEMRRAAEDGRADSERWHLRKDGSRFWASGAVMPLLEGEKGGLRGFLKILRDHTAARAEEERRRVLVAELNHRVKNTLAVVQSLASQTLRNHGVSAEVQKTLLARLAALARSHDLLTRDHWRGVLLPEVVRRTLEPHAGLVGAGRIALDGPLIRLAPGAAVTLNLAFHELATNAAKHGALSVPAGRVEVRWSTDRTDAESAGVEVVWRERGGPPVRQPGRRGFGSRLIERGLTREFGAEVRLDFAPEGVECRISLPLAAKVIAADGAPERRQPARPDDAREPPRPLSNGAGAANRL